MKSNKFMPHSYNNKSQIFIYYAALTLCFFIPFPYAPWRISLLSTLLFLAWLIEGNLKNKLATLKSNRIFLALALFLIFNIFSLLWSQYIDTGIDSLDPFFYFFLAIPPLVTSIPKQKVKTLIFVFVLGVMVHAIIVYLDIFFNFGNKITEKFYSPYAIYGPFTAFASLYFANKVFSYPFLSYKSNINIFLFISLGTLIFIMPGRSGQFAFMLGLLVLIIMHCKKLQTTIVLAACIILVFYAEIYYSNQTDTGFTTAKSETYNALFHQDYTGSFGARIGLFLAGLDVAKSNLLFGAGVGDSRDEFQRLIESGKNQNYYVLAYWDTPHNQFISLLTKTGIIGFSLFVIYIFFFFRMNINDRDLKILSVLFIFMFCINSFADEILYMKPYNTYFAVLSALFMNAASSSKNNVVQPEPA